MRRTGDWLKEAGFDTGTSVTLKISEGGIVLMADTDEVRELGEDLYKVKQEVRGDESGDA
ncbi:SymE family type I addiction module toxin [Salmonella bongori]|nr:SymE family type I addiction module toxin [Salmonella bongori]EIT4621729.1 SymE family type I addiction module toxin [Salmonella bongori]